MIGRRSLRERYSGTLLPVLAPGRPLADVDPDKPIPFALTDTGLRVTETVVPTREGEA